jgi:two-component system, OmpR family, response regulator
MRLLVVDDEASVREVLALVLDLSGFEVATAANGSEAIRTLALDSPDAVILDVLMPGLDGLEVCRRMRATGDRTPVLMLTARTEVSERVEGLEAGADDYLVKPFELEELAARIRAVARRKAERGEPGVEIGEVRLDPSMRQVTRGGEPVVLSAREYAVLEALMARPGAILSRAQLEDRLYGWGDAIESNAVSVYIHQLRRKLGNDFIRNVRGVGYYVGRPEANR